MGPVSPHRAVQRPQAPNPTLLGCSHPERPSARRGPQPWKQHPEIWHGPAQPGGCRSPPEPPSPAVGRSHRAGSPKDSEQDPLILSPPGAPAAFPARGTRGGGSYLGDGDGFAEISSPGDAEAPRRRAGQCHCHRHGSGGSGRARREMSAIPGRGSVDPPPPTHRPPNEGLPVAAAP